MSAFLTRLQKKVEERATVRTEQIVFGQIQAEKEYWQNVGYLAAVREIMQLCEEVESEIVKGD